MFPLVEMTIATSIAVLFVVVLRIPLRRTAGAQAAYWLWLMVPASALAVSLPAPANSSGIATLAVPEPISHAIAGTVVALTASGPSMTYPSIGLLVWMAGAWVMLALMVRRHRDFVRSLGSLSLLPNGAYRSASVVEPMLVGAWRPRIVLPADFETRYTGEECALVLAHERAHMRRGDALVNAAATGWLCVFWFNPLMYWAIGRFRFDQELACDAFVLAATGAARRRYAGALLKTQLAAYFAGPVPIGCHWQSSHPLKERVAVLKRPIPGFMRHAFGVALALVSIVAGSCFVWAAQPRPLPAAAMDMKWLVEDKGAQVAGGALLTKDVLITDINGAQTVWMQSRSGQGQPGSAVEAAPPGPPKAIHRKCQTPRKPASPA
jgi:beta-lactamase regulating signal transducer with metallopeptidase domain